MAYEYDKLPQKVKNAIRKAARHQYLLGTAAVKGDVPVELRETASISEDKVFKLIEKIYGECTCAKPKSEVWHSCRSYDQHVIASLFLDDTYEIAYLNASVEYPTSSKELGNTINKTIDYIESIIRL
jgi:hypothetical protein